MPDDRAPIRRVHTEASAIAEQNAQMREQVKKALEILKTDVPDTFLGRKTHEPFPSEDGDERGH
ncbi:hypothetical protein [Bradyrhizobium guangdongense]